ncbi:hypothetical protein MAR_030803 [Mya arenaria]|uniref:Protein kinase domain-containing protein n=1 Tax=Mya arenaria TaxID=6604 RepID=A0ABY7F4T8_MYAAR|nr:hypothetical protein MAR_030803 [Mya arenaria]
MDYKKTMAELKEKFQTPGTEAVHPTGTGLGNGKVTLDRDKSGKLDVQFTETQKIPWDGSEPGKIATPKSDHGVNTKTEMCLRLLEYIKGNKPPVGVMFDKTKIMISHINPNEIRCWVTLMETGYVPQLYMFRIDGDAVVINMESLETAKTLEEIINEENLRKAENADLLKPFSLYVLDGALEALCDMHNKEWAHNDLHGGNVMLDNELKIKIIDFGCVNKFHDLHQEKLSAEDEADRIDDEADCIEDEADCIGDEEECIGAEADYIGGETFALLPDLDLDSVAAKITDQQINELCRQCGLSL